MNEPDIDSVSMQHVIPSCLCCKYLFHSFLGL
uniref:Uncharacterized protein n=1 Tax=Arundo donax TaxID=35708 RepID=A0A0A8ZI35_ARUDO